MSSGGARAKAGPAPDPRSGRSDRKGIKFRALPPEGYQGDPPKWPLKRMTRVTESGKTVADPVLTKIEQRIWADAWRLPQAAAWAAEPWRIYTVAQWARVAALCETPQAKAADRTVMLRLQEEIGLTGPGLARNGWVIGEAPGTRADDADVDRPARRRRSARDRMGVKVIDGGRA